MQKKHLTKINTYDDKNSQQTGNRGGLLQLDKEYLQKPTVSIILNGEKPDAVLLRSGVRQECSFSLLLLDSILEVPDNATRQEKEIKGVLTGKI